MKRGYRTAAGGGTTVAKSQSTSLAKSYYEVIIPSTFSYEPRESTFVLDDVLKIHIVVVDHGYRLTWTGYHCVDDAPAIKIPQWVAPARVGSYRSVKAAINFFQETLPVRGRYMELAAFRAI
jgi:hypothetical protein